MAFEFVFILGVLILTPDLFFLHFNSYFFNRSKPTDVINRSIRNRFKTPNLNFCPVCILSWGDVMWFIGALWQ